MCDLEAVCVAAAALEVMWFGGNLLENTPRGMFFTLSCSLPRVMVAGVGDSYGGVHSGQCSCSGRVAHVHVDIQMHKCTCTRAHTQTSFCTVIPLCIFPMGASYCSFVSLGEAHSSPVWSAPGRCRQRGASPASVGGSVPKKPLASLHL